MSAPVKWTPTRIRKATPFPKPAGCLAAFRRREGHHLEVEEPLATRLLRLLIENADLLDVSHGGYRFLLVPVAEHELDQLAAFGAAAEDTEEEAVGADSIAHSGEDDEPSLGRCDANLDQTIWPGCGSDLEDEGGNEPDIVPPETASRFNGPTSMSLKAWRADKPRVWST